MRIRSLFKPLLLLPALLSWACGDSTAPKADTMQAVPSHGWQVVIQASSLSPVGAVAAMRTDAFNGLTMEDFDIVESAAFDLKSMNDTVYVGYVLNYGYGYGPKESRSIFWNMSGSMSSSAAGKIDFGPLSSLYEVSQIDTNFNYAVVSSGKQALSLSGDDFLFTQKIDGKYTYQTRVAVVVYRAFTCADFASRRLESNGLTLSVVDSNFSAKRKFSAPEVKITCNPPAPSSLRASEPEVRRVRLTDYLREHIEMLPITIHKSR